MLASWLLCRPVRRPAARLQPESLIIFIGDGWSWNGNCRAAALRRLHARLPGPLDKSGFHIKTAFDAKSTSPLLEGHSLKTAWDPADFFGGP